MLVANHFIEIHYFFMINYTDYIDWKENTLRRIKENHQYVNYERFKLPCL